MVAERVPAWPRERYTIPAGLLATASDSMAAASVIAASQRDGLEAGASSFPGTLLGPAQAIRIVERLHRGLPARAQAAAAHRVKRVAIDFLDGGKALPNLLALQLNRALGLHHADDRAAARGALAADAGVPGLHAGNDRFFGNEQRDDLARRVAASARNRAARRRPHQFEKITSVHGVFFSLVAGRAVFAGLVLAVAGRGTCPWYGSPALSPPSCG